LRTLNILHLEDSPLDAELIEAHLSDGGLDCRLVRVQTSAEFTAALEQQAFDLILADYALPSFDGLTALKSRHMNAGMCRSCLSRERLARSWRSRR